MAAAAVSTVASWLGSAAAAGDPPAGFIRVAGKDKSMAGGAGTAGPPSSVTTGMGGTWTGPRTTAPPGTGPGAETRLSTGSTGSEGSAASPGIAVTVATASGMVRGASGGGSERGPDGIADENESDPADIVDIPMAAPTARMRPRDIRPTGRRPDRCPPDSKVSVTRGAAVGGLNAALGVVTGSTGDVGATFDWRRIGNGSAGSDTAIGAIWGELPSDNATGEEVSGASSCSSAAR